MKKSIEVENNMSFEDAVKKIEDIIKEMENGRLPLEQSLERFEDGIKLVKLCNTKLDNYEKKITLVIEGKDGKLIEKEVEFND